MPVVHYNSGVFYAWIDGVLTTIPIGDSNSPNIGLSSPLGIDERDEPFEPILFNQPSLDNVAYTNKANIFTQHQLINRSQAQLGLLHSGTARGRVQQYLGNVMSFSSNLNWTGSGWDLDDTSLPGLLFELDPATNGFRFFEATAGANPRTLVQLIRVPKGGGITFPAIQLVSSDANTLDDYEEGTWTPAIQGSGGQSGQVYSTQNGRYVKIGRLVYIQGHIILSTLGTITGAVLLSGLPFTSGSVLDATCPVGVWYNLNTGYVNVSGDLGTNDTRITLLAITAAATDNLTGTMAQANLTNTSQFRFSMCYEAAN